MNQFDKGKVEGRKELVRHILNLDKRQSIKESIPAWLENILHEER